MTTDGIAHVKDEKISLKDFILKLKKGYKYLLSKWFLILVFGILGGIIGFVYAYLKKPLYIATTTFVLESGESGGGLGQYAGLASMVGIDIGGSGGGIFQGENILELYKSRTMIEKTLLSEVEISGKKRLLISRFIEMNHLREKWSKKPSLNNVNFDFKSKNEMFLFTRVQDSIIGSIVTEINKRYLKVSKPDKKLSIIRVEVSSEDEFFAKLFNDQIVKNVNDFYVQTKTKKSLENIKILSEKTDSVRNVMNGAIYNISAISDATPNLNPTRQLQRTAPIQRSQFSVETNKAILGELVKNLEMSKMSLLRETPLIQVIDYPIYPISIVKPGKLTSLILGSLISTVLLMVILLFRRLIKHILEEQNSY